MPLVEPRRPILVRLRENYVKFIVILYLWIFQFIIAHLIVSLFFEGSQSAVYQASASSDFINNQTHGTSVQTITNKPSPGIEEKCADCRLVSNSIEEILRKPRQMSAYGQVEERIDLEKLKKGICKELVNDYERERCRNFYFTNSDSIFKWKQQTQSTKTSFYDAICIKGLKYCCPRNSFGPKCSKCTKCNYLNEHCHGEGTRAGNGSCVCNEGHTGPKCEICLPGYHLETSKENVSIKRKVCKKCHRSCQYCRSEGPLGCEVCQSGFNWVPAFGCSDIDECLASNNKICGDNTFCVNTEGSYFCYECDRACDGCHGDGPDMCLRCARGYKLDNGNCVALKKTLLPPEANYYRYAIYTGLCICTCIILHNNVYLAALIGLGVATYIGMSEYIMSTHFHEMAQAPYSSA